MTNESPALSAVPSTLRIPLAARALGGKLFPEMAVDDRYAIEALARMGDDGSQWLSDRKSIYGTLARTRRFRDQARDFVARHPDAQVVNLGCGLSDYLQWIDNDQVRMLDVDLSEVMAIRREILPPRHERHVLAELDLTAPDWWERLGLLRQPRRGPGVPDERRRLHVPAAAYRQRRTRHLRRARPGRLGIDL